VLLRQCARRTCPRLSSVCIYEDDRLDLTTDKTGKASDATVLRASVGIIWPAAAVCAASRLYAHWR